MGHVVKAIDYGKLNTIIWNSQTIEQGRLSSLIIHFITHFTEAFEELFIWGQLQIAVLVLPFNFKFVEFFAEESDNFDDSNEELVDNRVD